MEFIVQTDLTLLPKSIDFNFEDMKSELAVRLEQYNALVVTEESIKSAKEDRAKLNKLKTAVEDKRKEIKKMCLAPYTEFETKCKEIVAMIYKPIVAIDTQVKTFDEAKKQEKYALLCECFNENIGDLADLVKFECVLNPKWANVTVELDTLKNEIVDTIDRVKSELNTIDEQFSEVPYKTAILSEYLKDLSLSKALVKASMLKQEAGMQEKALAERRKREEERKNVQIQHQQATKSVSKVEVVKNEPIEECAVESTSEQLYNVSFRVTHVTKQQILGLRDFLKAANMNFEIIK